MIGLFGGGVGLAGTLPSTDGGGQRSWTLVDFGAATDKQQSSVGILVVAGVESFNSYA